MRLTGDDEAARSPHEERDYYGRPLTPQERTNAGLPHEEPGPILREPIVPIRRRTPEEIVAYLEGYTAGTKHVFDALDRGTTTAVLRGYVDSTLDLMRTAVQAESKGKDQT